MPHSPDEIGNALDRLLARMDELEKRLSALERRETAAVAAQPAPGALPPHPVEQLSLAHSAGAMPTIGKVFLGIAGAYLLRAVAEAGVLPKLAIIPLAMAHAGLWLVWSARAHSRSTFASGAYALTASLILSPMLWELSMAPRFKALALPPTVTAGVLLAFVLGASVLGWKGRLTAVVWAPMAAAAATSLALMIATGDPVPFVLALLVMWLAGEVAAESGRWPGLRLAPALVADVAVTVLVLIYTREGGAPPDYRPVPAATLLSLFAILFTLAAGATLSQTVFLRRPIRYFDVTQTVATFVIASVGVLRAGHGPAAAESLGIFCLALAAGCYMLAFARFDGAANVREYHVFAAWAAALLVMGSVLSLSSAAAQTTWLGLAALGALMGSIRTERLTLAYDAVVFLVAAALVSGALSHAGRYLAGEVPGSPGALVWVSVVTVFIAYLLTWRLAGETRPRQIVRLAFAVLAVYMATGLLVAAIARIAPAVLPLTPPALSAVRTLVICLAAMAAAFAGSQSRRAELAWLAYTIMALCTLKLLLEDLQAGNAVSLAFSLFFYGMSWVLVPRLARATKKE
jgi:hypothetical protein